MGKDADGGTELLLDKTASTQDFCLQDVLEYKRNNPAQSVNGATWGPGSKSCYAEIGATHLSSDSAWNSCIFSTAT